MPTNELKLSLVALTLALNALSGVIASVPAHVIEIVPPVEAATTAKNPFEGLPSILLRIGGCESAGGPNKTPRQFTDGGNLIVGWYDKDDTGAFQINTRYHLKEAVSMGIDIYTLEGNIKYAEYLYKKNGTSDWLASKNCWKI